MAQRVLFLTNILLACLIPGSCSEPGIPSVFIDENVLVTKQGVTYFERKRFSGYALKLFSNGDTMRIASYQNGKAHGILKEWYENKVLKETRFFVEGYKTGEHKGWFENGQIRFVAHFEKDAYEGNVKEWQANGMLYRDFNYENGQESGAQKMWESDGRLKANYVVRNGRKYGLAGNKNCVSTLH